MLANGLIRYFLVGGADLGCLEPLDDPLAELGESLPSVSPMTASYYKPSLLDVFPVPSTRESAVCIQALNFCFPMGVQVYTSEPDGPRELFHTFHMQFEEGCYGAVLTFYQEVANAVTSAGAFPRLFVPRCICLLARRPHYKTMRDCLMALYPMRDHCDEPSCTPIEHHISTLLLEVPVLPEGTSYEVVLPFLGTQLRFAQSAPDELPLLEFDTEDIILAFLPKGEDMSSTSLSKAVRTLVEIVFCLLLENKLIFHSTDPERLNRIITVLLALLFPFEWQMQKNASDAVSVHQPPQCGLYHPPCTLR
eukprot:gnl/Hemi2/8608_TR2984_c0_g1_i1.p1 gnl/Hemi2/8608_TR2984_c0_g1~~gnl/Hemi2/8608_TR2984_c0_g1_i1.p1  ORF type:complete len:307 (-),score=20.74 gnl/Hemi2/8608_TR2984_c0_g1_i1:3-923(-)